MTKTREKEDELPELMTTEEVAHFLRISRNTVAKEAALGTIPGKKFGRMWRFSRPEMKKLIGDGE